MYLAQRYEYRVLLQNLKSGQYFGGCVFRSFFHIFMDKIRIFERWSICTKKLTHIKVRKLSILALKCTYLGENRINQLHTIVAARFI